MILFPHLALPVLFFLPLFIPAPPLVSLSRCFSSASHGTLSPALYFFSFCVFSSASLTHSLLLCTCVSIPCSLPAHSSLCAGCRGSCFTFTMSRINVRVRQLLFSSLLRQDLSFFQDTKTGGAWSPDLGFPWTFLAPQLRSIPETASLPTYTHCAGVRGC